MWVEAARARESGSLELQILSVFFSLQKALRSCCLRRRKRDSSQVPKSPEQIAHDQREAGECIPKIENREYRQRVLGFSERRRFALVQIRPVLARGDLLVGATRQHRVPSEAGAAAAAPRRARRPARAPRALPLARHASTSPAAAESAPNYILIELE